MKITSAILATLAASALTAQAAITITISAVSGATNGVLTNLASSTGNVTSTKVWGIVVDTNNDGVLAGQYLGSSLATPTLGPSLAQGAAAAATTSVLKVANLLGDAAVNTDDILFIGVNLMINTNSATVDGGTVGTLARPTQITGIDFLGNGLALNDDFYVMWFDVTSFGGTAQVGDNYGMMRLTGMDLDADGTARSYNQLFLGADPVRTASSEFVGLIPEPSTAALGLLAGLGLVARRRRD